MGFQQGLSGLNAAAKNLDVIGNNVANANTVGFKQSKAQFADVYARSLVGASDSQVGLGVKVGSVAQEFSQGSISLTNNPLDIAINGNGFFRVVDPTSQSVSYTRNGQFQTDKAGNIITMSGMRLTGYPVNAITGLPDTNAPLQPLTVPVGDQAPQRTDSVVMKLNLDAEATPPVVTTFSPGNTNSFNHSTSIPVYDSLGSEHLLTAYYVRNDQVANPAASAWTVHFAIDNVQVAGVTQDLDFNNSGALTPPPAMVNVPVNGQTFTFDSIGTTQYGGSFGETETRQNGYGIGRLASFSVDKDGVILGRYSNGRTAALGQVALANFRSVQDLESIGDNLWNETAGSGAASVGAPGSGMLGLLQASAVEESNVDLTAELVNMITAQRVYQANAQTIKTQDTILQTMVNLR